MADAGPTPARVLSASDWRFGSRVVFSGVPGRGHLEDHPAGIRSGGLDLFAGEVGPVRTDHHGVGAAELGVVLLLEPADASHVASPQDPGRGFDLFCRGLADGTEDCPGESAAGGQRLAFRDGAGTRDGRDLLVRDGAAFFTEGDGRDECLGAGRRNLLRRRRRNPRPPVRPVWWRTRPRPLNPGAACRSRLSPRGGT